MNKNIGKTYGGGKHWQHKWTIKEKVILDWTLAVLQFQCVNAHTGRREEKYLRKSGKGNPQRAQGAETILRRGPFRINVWSQNNRYIGFSICS